jgi:hypothetical protein
VWDASVTLVALGYHQRISLLSIVDNATDSREVASHWTRRNRVNFWLSPPPPSSDGRAVRPRRFAIPVSLRRRMIAATFYLPITGGVPATGTPTSQDYPVYPLSAGGDKTTTEVPSASRPAQLMLSPHMAQDSVPWRQRPLDSPSACARLYRSPHDDCR